MTSTILSRAGRPIRRLRAVPHIGIYLGLLVITVGASLLVLAWGQTTGLTDVALQVPYVLSAGFPGVGLIVVGVTIVNVSVERENTADKAEQTAELTALLAEVRRSMEGEHR